MEGQKPAPPVQAKKELLPFGELGWEHFESLCLCLLREEGGLGEVLRKSKFAGKYGRPGEKQDGIDVFAETDGGKFATAQCRRIQRLTPAGLNSAVQDFLEGSWAEDSSQFIYATSADTSSTALVDACKQLKGRLREEHGIEFQLWGKRHLSDLLRGRPEIVEQFFSAAWVDAFCVTGVPETTREQFLSGPEASPGNVVILDATAATDAVGNAAKKLTKEAPAYSYLAADLWEFDDKERAERAGTMITDSGEALDDAPWQAWLFLARVAAAGGEWGTAAHALNEVAARREKPARALIEAAVAASISGDEGAYASYIGRARASDPRHPKLLLEDIGQDDLRPEAVLERLDDFSSDSQEDVALAACHRARAHIMLDQLDRAEEELGKARRINPDTVQVRTVDVNIKVQRGRAAMLSDGFIDDEELETAIQAALELRKKLLAQARATEAGRLLMLAVDAATLRYEPERAARLLGEATGEELIRPVDRSALVDAAMRGGHWSLADKLLKGAPDTDEFRRLRASARLALRPKDPEPREELEQLLGSDEEGAQAATALCQHSAMRGSPWSPKAEERLMQTHPDRAVSLKALHLADSRKYGEAKKLLRKHLSESWAQQTLFDLAVLHRDQTEAMKHVDDILARNPNRAIRASCAAVLLEEGRLKDAEAQARLVADSKAASPRTRGEAYFVLTRVLCGEERYDEATRCLEAWSKAWPGDVRIGTWRAHVGNRQLQEARDRAGRPT